MGHLSWNSTAKGASFGLSQRFQLTCCLSLSSCSHVGKVGLVGTTGLKFPGIRKHLKEKISDYYGGLDTETVTFPPDDVKRDPLACRLRPYGWPLSLAAGAHHMPERPLSDVAVVSRTRPSHQPSGHPVRFTDKAALDSMKKGDVATIFTPDDTHFDIAKCVPCPWALGRCRPALRTTVADHRLTQRKRGRLLGCSCSISIICQPLTEHDACATPPPFLPVRYAIERGLHVLVTKPPVKTLAEHQELAQLAHKHGVLVMVE